MRLLQRGIYVHAQLNDRMQPIFFVLKIKKSAVRSRQRISRGPYVWFFETH